MHPKVSRLIRACSEGDTELVKQLLLHDVPYLDRHVIREAVQQANRNRHLNVIHFLLTHPEIDTVDALIVASKFGFLDIIRQLLTRGDLGYGHVHDYIVYALTEASENGHTRVVEFLMTQFKADPMDEEDKGERTRALRLATRNGHIRIVQLLLRYRDLDPWTFEDDDDENSILDEAAIKGYVDIMRIFLADDRVRRRIIEDGAEVLGQAAAAGHAQIVELLLNEGVHPDIDALESAVIGGHLDVVRILLEDDDDREAIEMDEDLYDQLSDLALDRGHVDLAQFLMVIKANQSTETNSGIYTWDKSCETLGDRRTTKLTKLRALASELGIEAKDLNKTALCHALSERAKRPFFPDAHDCDLETVDPWTLEKMAATPPLKRYKIGQHCFDLQSLEKAVQIGTTKNPFDRSDLPTPQIINDARTLSRFMRRSAHS